MWKPSSRDGSHEWTTVATLSLAFGFLDLDRFVLPPVFPAMIKDLHLTYWDLANLVGVLALVWGIFAIAVGNLSGRIGRRYVLVPAVALFSLLSALRGMAGYGIQYTLYFALAGLVIAAVVSMFLEEPAPGVQERVST